MGPEECERVEELGGGRLLLSHPFSLKSEGKLAPFRSSQGLPQWFYSDHSSIHISSVYLLPGMCWSSFCAKIFSGAQASLQEIGQPPHK